MFKLVGLYLLYQKVIIPLLNNKELNIVVITPRAKVTANPLTGPEPNWNRIKAASKVVIFASTIVLKASLKPLSIAPILDLPDLDSSLILSKIRTLASTAMPIVNAIPASPGKVNVASNIPNNEIINKTFIISDIFAATPNRIP